MGLQADGAAQWLNHRDRNLLKNRASRRANGGDAINELMSADEEMTYHGPLLKPYISALTSRTNGSILNLMVPGLVVAITL